MGAAVRRAVRHGGWEPGWEGLKALKGKTLDVDLLMVVAALGAAAIGQVLDDALLIVIFATPGAPEAIATARTADSMQGLLDLAPETATRLTGDGTEETVPAGDLAVGDTVLVRPGERVAAVHELQGACAKVLVIGDGVNDAPALAAAHTGIAMGRAGSDLALETADAVVVRDELLTIPTVVNLSRHARKLVIQNLAVAGTFIAVLVGLNGLRLVTDGAWRRARHENGGRCGGSRQTFSAVTRGWSAVSMALWIPSVAIVRPRSYGCRFC